MSSKDQYYKRLESLFSNSESVTPEPVNGKVAAAENEVAALRSRVAELEAALAEAQARLEAAVTAPQAVEAPPPNGVHAHAGSSLHVDEARLSVAMQVAQLAYWEYDFVNDVFTFNDRFYALFHTTVEREGGYQMPAARYAQQFVHPDDAAVVGVEIQKSIETTDPGYSAQIDHRILYADGGVGYITVRFRIEKDAQGRTVRSYGANQDITDRKLAEQSASATQAQLADALQVAQLAYWEYDFVNDVFTFNDQFYALFHTTVEREGGYQMPAARYAQQFVHPDDAAVVGVEIQKSIETTDPGYSAQIDHRILYADGGVGYITVRFRIEKDAQGRTVRSYGANQDITRRKHIEDTLRLTEERFSRAFAGVPLAMSIHHYASNRFLDVNEQFCTLLGYSTEEVIGRVASEMNLWVNHDDRARVYELLERNRRVRDFPTRFRTKSGEQRDILFSFELFEASGEQYVLAIISDVTARKRSEQALSKQANELATVAQVSIAATTLLQPDKLLQEVVDLTKFSFELYHAHIYLLNDAGDTLVLIAGADEVGRQMVAAGRIIPLAQEQSLVARAARTRQGVLVNDVTQDAGFLPHALLPNTRSEMAIPMIIGDQVLGVLDVQADTINRFTDDDLQIQTTLAAQVAVALHNARQHEQTQAALKELDALTRRLTREGWHEYLTARPDRMGYAYDLYEIKPLASEEVVAHNGGMIEQALTIRGQTIGRLAIAEAAQADEDAAEIVAAVSAQLSAHLENLRLTEQTQAALVEAEDQAYRLARLSELGEEISRANTTQEILEAVTAKTNEIIQSDRTSIILLTESGDHFQTIALGGKSAVPAASGTLHPLAGTTAEMAVKQNRVVVVSDPDLTQLTGMHYLVAQGVRTFMNAPLMAAGSAIGTLNVASERPNAYNIRDENLMSQVASLLAAALENQRLLEQTQKRAVELEAIAKVSSAASTILDVEALLQAVVDLTKASFHLYHAHIYLLNEEGDTLVLAAGAGDVGRKLVDAGHAIALNREHSLVARAARTRSGVRVNDVTQEPDFLPNPYLPNTRSELSVPMIVGDKLVGVFDVQSDALNRFTEDDVQLKITLSDQVAVALQNARLYSEQAQTVERLRELDQLKSSFLANMSHELRTPLNSILGFAQVMLEGIDGELTNQMENDLSVIQKNGQHLLNLISDILDMAKIEAGKMTLNPEIFDLKEVVDEVVDLTSPLAGAKKLIVSVNTGEHDTLDLYADRIRLRQVLINVINNAIKFTEAGRIDISARRQEAVIRVVIKDTGIGIPPNHLDKIFEEFSQVDSSTTRKAGGTGLGLPISRHLVEMHGGRLWAESTGVPGEGSSFIVELPVETTYTQ